MSAVRQLIADNKIALSNEAVAMKADIQRAKLAAEVEQIERRIRKLRNENELKDGENLPRTLVGEHLERIAGLLKGLGDKLGRKSNIKGVDAQAMLNHVLEGFARELKRLKT